MTTLPDWYTPAMAEQDRLHDGVAWRCRSHGLLSAQYVLILGTVTYCGACVEDGTERPEHIPVVAHPRPALRGGWNDRTGPGRPRKARPPKEPKRGSLTARILAAARAKGERGIRHRDLVKQFGNSANGLIRSLKKRGFLAFVGVGRVRAL